MNGIRLTADCLASGQPLEAGRLYRVPQDVCAEDAATLVKIGRAVVDEPEQDAEPKPKRGRQRADA